MYLKSAVNPDISRYDCISFSLKPVFYFINCQYRFMYAFNEVERKIMIIKNLQVYFT